MKSINGYAVQNYVIVPAALAANQQAPQNIGKQKWLMTLSGVAIINFKSTSNNDWTGETFILDPDSNTPMQYAINQFSIPVPTDSPYEIDSFDLPRIKPMFQVEQYTINAALGSIFDKNSAINAGFSVNSWRPAPFLSLSDSRPDGNAPVIKRILRGFLIDVAVRDIDAYLYRINFQINLLGKIIFVKNKGM
jgi:hypothetical protein